MNQKENREVVCLLETAKFGRGEFKQRSWMFASISETDGELISSI